MRATIINRLSLLVVICALLTVMTGSVSAATMPEVKSSSAFIMGEWDADSCPYSSGYGAEAKLSLPPATQ